MKRIFDVYTQNKCQIKIACSLLNENRIKNRFNFRYSRAKKKRGVTSRSSSYTKCDAIDDRGQQINKLSI